MLPHRDRAGRIWVDERLAAWAMAHGVQLDALGWSTADGAAETVAVTVGARVLRVSIAAADLDRLPYDADVRERVDEQCAELMGQFIG